MAITKTTTVERIEILQPNLPSAAVTENDGNYRMTVIFQDVMDDPSDSEMPVTVQRVKHFVRYDAEGNENDMSSYGSLVTSVASAIWS